MLSSLVEAQSTAVQAARQLQDRLTALASAHCMSDRPHRR